MVTSPPTHTHTYTLVMHGDYAYRQSCLLIFLSCLPRPEFCVISIHGSINSVKFTCFERTPDVFPQLIHIGLLRTLPIPVDMLNVSNLMGRPISFCVVRLILGWCRGCISFIEASGGVGVGTSWSFGIKIMQFGYNVGLCYCTQCNCRPEAPWSRLSWFVRHIGLLEQHRMWNLQR